MVLMRVMLATAAIIAATPAMAGDVTVHVKGVEAAKGDLYVALQTRDQFMKEAGTAGEIVHQPAPGDHDIVLKDVPPGEYSVAVWHDINGNRTFDREANGRPLDGWAMINGTTLRATPIFDQVKLVVPQSGADASVTMTYHR